MKFLFIAAHDFLEKQYNGGTKCSYRNYQSFIKIFGSDQVHLITFTNSDVKFSSNVTVFPTHRNEIERIFNTFCMRNVYAKKTEEKVLEYIARLNPDVVYFDTSLIGVLITKISQKYKTIVFMQNVESDYVWNKVKHEGIGYLLPFASYLYNEKRMMKNVDHIIALNNRDEHRIKELYNRECGRHPGRHLPHD